MQDTTKGSLIYVIHAKGTSFVKIGVTTRPDNRLRSIQTGCPHLCEIARLWSGGYDLESRLHERFSEHRRSGEWFEFPECSVDEIVSAVGAAIIEIEPPVTVYDAPVAVLEARHRIKVLLECDDVSKIHRLAAQALEHLNLAVRAMAADDLALVIKEGSRP